MAWVIDAIPHALAPFLVGRLSGSIPLGIAAFLITGIVWSILPEARAGQTVGKALAGIRVRDHRWDGDGTEAAPSPPLGFARAAVRWLVKYLVGGVLPVSYLWYFRDPSGRTWHDLAAGTFVVSDRRG